MITRKDLAPIDDKSLELWRKKLKLIKDKTLRDLYVFSRDFMLGHAVTIIMERFVTVVKTMIFVRVVN